jgi:hypothetical protein
MVPLTSQPVVGAAGKSNMKELFHKSETSKLVDSIARGLGVRTSGAGYSIQTTKPRFNAGGKIEDFGQNKTRVSGPASITYDDRMGSIPLGGYVLNQAASMDPANAKLVAAAPSTHNNSGSNITALLTPKETVFGPGIQDNPELLAAVDAANNGRPLPRRMGGGKINLSTSNYGAINPAVMVKILSQLFKRNPKLSREMLRGRDMSLSGAEARAYQESVFGTALRSSSRELSRQYYFVGNWGGRLRASVNTALSHGAAKKADIVSDLMHGSSQQALPSLTRFLQVNKVPPDKIALLTDRARANMVSGLSGTGKIGEAEWSRLQHKEYLAVAKELRLRKEYLESLNVPGQRRAHSTDPVARGIQAETALNPYGKTDLEKLIAANDANGTRYMGSYRNYGIEKINGEPTALAHMMPKFSGGGMIGNVLKGLAMRRIGAGFGPTGAPKPSMYESAPWGVNSLSIGMAETLFANSGLRKNTQKLFYDKFAAAMAKEKPYGYVKDAKTGSLKHGLEPDVLDSIIRSAASDLIGDRNVLRQLSPIDRDILKNKYLNWDSKQNTPMTAELKKKIFDISGNREMGGPVSPGQNYIVGEKGPEIFRPLQSGSIIPGYEVGGVIKYGKDSYGLSGNPAKRAEQLAEKAARAEAAKSYGGQRSFPYAPGLRLPLSGAGSSIDSAFSSMASSLKAGSNKLITSTRMINDQVSYSIRSLVDGSRLYADSITSSAKSIGSSYKRGGSEILIAGAPGAFPGGKEDRAQRMASSFRTNAAYSTAAIMHPIQYLKTKGLNPEFGQGAGANMVGMMGGMAAGGAIGGKLGGQNGAMMGSMAGMMGGQMLLPKIGGMIGKRAAASAATAGLASAGFGATAAAAAGLVAPLAAVTAAGIAGYKMWKHYKEGQDLNIASFGLTAEAAKKAGLRFTDFGARIKDTIQNAKDMADANKLVYESMKDGGTPFQMTTAEYTKLKVEVKETFGEQIDILNRQPSTKVPDAVSRIKEQLVAAGMSAEEATKKIYTMLQLSNKKDQSITATLGNADFKAITDPQSAAVSAVTSFGEDTKTQGNKEKAAQLNTALTATETAINDLIEKRERLVAKDLTGKVKSLSFAEAEKIVIDQINNSKEAGTVIDEGTISAMEEINPGIRKMINGSDTVVSVWQKIRLQAQGFTGDLNKLNAEQTQLIADAFAAISTSVVATNSAKGGLLEKQYTALGKLEDKIKSYTQALKGQKVSEQISDRERLSSLNKQIEANNKLAEARKKALSAAQADADLGRQIEKTRIAMLNAEATGDTQKSQELRLDLESLTSQQQTESQSKAIDKANELANAPLKAAIEAMAKNQQKAADSAALAGESLESYRKKQEESVAAIDKVNNSMTALYGNAEAAGKSVEEYVKTNKEAAAGFVAAVEAATGEKMPRYLDFQNYEGGQVVSKKVAVSPQANALSILAKAGAGSAVNDALANSIKGGASLKDIVDAIQNKEDSKKLKKISYAIKESGYSANKVGAGALSAAGISSGEQVLGTTFLDKDGVKWKISSRPVGGYNSDWGVTKAGFGTMNLNPKIPTIVGDRGPEMVFGNMVIPNMAKVPFASPRYDLKEAAKRFEPMQQRSSSASYVVNQNIYASEGMDVEALSNMIVKKAEIVIGQKAKVNVKMIGQGKNI